MRALHRIFFLLQYINRNKDCEGPNYKSEAACGSLGFSSCRNVPNLSGGVGTSSGQFIPFSLPLPRFVRGEREDFFRLEGIKRRNFGRSDSQDSNVLS